MSATPRALEGIRVVDFGQFVAGPLTGMLLADYGAEVIRVDPPGGRIWSTPADAVLSRGKKSIVLDLKTDADRAIAERLVDGADVVIENFRPGVMDRLGLGARRMTERNQRLLYCSLPGFSHDDPRAALAAYEEIVGAATGVFTPMPLPEGAEPVYTAIPLASNVAAFLAAFTIVAALVARDRDGKGQVIELSLHDAMFDIVSSPTTMPEANFPGSESPMSDVQLAAFSGGGTYQCKDGRWVDYWPVSHKFTGWFARAAGIEAWADDGLLDRNLVLESPAHMAELRQRLAALFSERTALEWEDLGKAAGVPLAIHRSSEEWIEHEHARESHAVIEVDDPEFGHMWQPGWAIGMSRTPAVVGSRHRLDADRDELLAGLDRPTSSPPVAEVAGPTPPTAVGRADPADGEVAPAPLAGLRVIDTAQIIAGPTVARLLADFGAEVVKINNPSAPTPVDHLFINRGKRMMLVNIRTPEGLDILNRLIDEADVLVQNFTRGRAEEFGMGFAQVSERRPSIVYCSLSAYGYGGPWGAGRGYEPVGQTTTGLTRRLGGDGKPLYQQMRRVADYGAGILGAFGVALALYERNRSGLGQHVDTSLAHACTFHQTPYLFSYDGKTWDEPSGQRARGRDALNRLYPALDGWFFLAAGRDADEARLRDAAELGDSVADEVLERALEQRFATRTLADWQPGLRAAGFEALALRTVPEMLDDPYSVSRGLSVSGTCGDVPVRTAGPAPRLSRTPVVPVRLPEPYGADTAAVLAELGLAEEAERLAERGIASSAPLGDAAVAR